MAHAAVFCMLRIMNHLSDAVIVILTGHEILRYSIFLEIDMGIVVGLG